MRTLKEVFLGWIAENVVTEDPAPEYSRLDRYDGRGEQEA